MKTIIFVVTLFLFFASGRIAKGDDSIDPSISNAFQFSRQKGSCEITIKIADPIIEKSDFYLVKLVNGKQVVVACSWQNDPEKLIYNGINISDQLNNRKIDSYIYGMIDGDKMTSYTYPLKDGNVNINKEVSDGVFVSLQVKEDIFLSWFKKK